MAGIISNDRKLGAEVRRLALGKIKVILETPEEDMTDKEKALHDQILLKLAGTALPRLTEVSGEDGEPIKYTLVSYADNTTSVPAETVSAPVT